MSLDGRAARYLGVALAVSFVVAGIWERASGYPVAPGLAIIAIGLVIAALIAVISRRGSTAH